jgi:hypothetical protein
LRRSSCNISAVLKTRNANMNVSHFPVNSQAAPLTFGRFGPKARKLALVALFAGAGVYVNTDFKVSVPPLADPHATTLITNTTYHTDRPWGHAALGGSLFKLTELAFGVIPGIGARIKRRLRPAPAVEEPATSRRPKTPKTPS